MTGVNGRYELLVYGSDDGEEWKVYEFMHKPTKLKSMPSFIAPHQPRLDWQMWFSALSPNLAPNNTYLYSFLFRILNGSKSVLSLLKHNPFPNAPPKYAKISKQIYQFTPKGTPMPSFYPDFRY
jgi:hypothetical protein